MTESQGSSRSEDRHPARAETTGRTLGQGIRVRARESGMFRPFSCVLESVAPPRGTPQAASGSPRCARGVPRRAIALGSRPMTTKRSPTRLRGPGAMLSSMPRPCGAGSPGGDAAPDATHPCARPGNCEEAGRKVSRKSVQPTSSFLQCPNTERLATIRGQLRKATELHHLMPNIRGAWRPRPVSSWIASRLASHVVGDPRADCDVSGSSVLAASTWCSDRGPARRRAELAGGSAWTRLVGAESTRWTGGGVPLGLAWFGVGTRFAPRRGADLRLRSLRLLGTRGVDMVLRSWPGEAPG